jgi:hypothetical protein
MKTTLFAFALCLVTIYTCAQENFESKEGKWGVRLNGKIIVPPTYDFINDYSDGLAQVQKNGKMGFIDKTGKIVIPIICNNTFEFTEGYVPEGI